MLTKQEILERLDNARSWREAGVTMEDVKAVLEFESSDTDKSSEIAELREKISTQNDTIKRLKAENKALKGR